MSRTWRRVRLDVRMWVVVGVFMAVAQDLMYERLWVLALLPLWAWMIVGLILLVVHSLRLPALTEPYDRTPNILSLLGGAVLFVLLSSLSGEVLQWARFRWHRSEYNRTVQALRQGLPVPTTLQYLIDAGPPTRVAFPWPGGIIDNWCGAVYDPTATVTRVNVVPLFTPAWRSHEATQLFGGDMVFCRPLEEPYYLCCFT